MAEIVFLVEDAPEGGFTARALGYSIYTEASNWDDLKQAIQDATACHFDEHHITIPQHKDLRIGTLKAILVDVADHLDLDYEDLPQALQ